MPKIAILNERQSRGGYHWGASKALVNLEPPRAAIPHDVIEESK
jgi:hypothetical protein